MMNNPKPISEFLVPGKRAHLVGIGGVSMCPLAEVLAGKGLLVQGSDMMERTPSSICGPRAFPLPSATTRKT